MKFFQTLSWVICSLVIVFCQPVFVQAAGVMFSPLRVVLEPDDKYAQVSLINQDKQEPIAFKLSTVALRMTESGGLIEPKELTKREEIARQIIRFSPRASMIQGGGRQVIRIMTRKPPNLPDGEYYTYLAAIPQKVEDTKRTSTGKQGLNMDISLLVGIRIPVIVRHGDVHEETVPLSARLVRDKKNKRFVEVVLERTGNMSSVVSIDITTVNDTDEEVTVAKNPRVVTYVPVKQHSVLIPVDDTFAGGKVKVTLRDLQKRARPVTVEKDFSI